MACGVSVPQGSVYFITQHRTHLWHLCNSLLSDVTCYQGVRNGKGFACSVVMDSPTFHWHNAESTRTVRGLWAICDGKRCQTLYRLEGYTRPVNVNNVMDWVKSEVVKTSWHLVHCPYCKRRVIDYAE